MGMKNMNEPRLLIVEDERVVAEDIRDMAVDLGYHVLGIASKGYETIELVANSKPDMVLMDIGLKGELDGVKVAGIIRDRFNTPVVYITAYADDDTLARAKLTEPLGYIVKPFDRQELNSILEMAFYRKGMEEQLRESEERFRNISELAGVGIVHSNANGEFQFVNQHFCDLLGYSSAELLTKSYPEITHPDDLEENLTLTKQLVSGVLSKFVLEKRYIRKSGDSIWVRLTVTLIRDSFGAPENFISVVEDISERKLADEELKLSEEKFSKAFYSSTALMMISSIATGEYDEVNDTFVQVTGYTREEAIGTTSIDLGLITQQARQQVITELQSAGQVREMELELNKKSGETMYCLFSGEIITIAGEDKLLSIAQDISDRVHAETALRDREHYIETLHNSMPDEICVIGPDHRVLDANNALLVAAGLDRKEAIGRHCYEVLYGFENPCRHYGKDCGYEQVFETSLPQSYLHLDLDNQEGRTHIDYQMSPLLNKHGEVDAVISVGRNVTEFFYWQRALQESEAMLQSIFRVAPVGIGLVDEDRNIIWANDALYNMTGYSVSELEGQNARILYASDEEYENVGRAKFQQSIEKGTSSIETHLVCKDGSAIEILLNSTPIDPDDQSQGMTFTALDITERKKAERSLRESEKRYRNLFDSVPVGIYRSTPGGRFLDGNPALMNILGFPDHKTMLAANIKDLYLTEWTREQELDLIEKNGFVSNHRMRLKRFDDVVIWVQDSANAIRDETGKTLYYYGRLEDVTENVKAAHAIEQRAIQMTLLNDVGSHIAAMLDLDNLLEQIVSLVQSTFGYHHVAIFTLNHDKQEAVMEALAGEFRHLFPTSHSLPFGQGVVGWVALNKECYFTNNSESDQKYVNLYPNVIPTISELAVPVILSEEFLGILDVQSPESNAFDQNDILVMETLANQIAIAIGNANLLEQIKAGRQRLSHLSHRLVEAQEGERRRIAQELHDEIGQTLTALSISLDGLTTYEMSDQVREQVADLIKQTQELTAQVHRLSLGLRPTILDDLGLAPAMASLFSRITAQAGLEVSFKHTGINGVRFPPDVEINAYRIVQEALTNIVRHASVESAMVQVWVESDLLWLQIQDEGPGFDLQSAIDGKKSMGVIGMSERAALTGGILTVETTPGKGTHISARLPLVPKRLDRRESERD